MRHAGQVVTRQQLLDAVWGFDFEPGSNVVDVYVGYLRRKLDRPGEDSVIEAVRGAGQRCQQKLQNRNRRPSASSCASAGWLPQIGQYPFSQEGSSTTNPARSCSQRQREGLRLW